MKVMVVTSNSDLSILKKLDESIVIYTANKDLNKQIPLIRDNIKHMTIVIFDKYKKTPNQVILEYGKRLEESGASDLEAFELTDREEYIVPVFIGIVILVILIIIALIFARTRNGKKE